MKSATGKLRLIRWGQHFIAAFIAFVIAYSVAGSNIMIKGINGSYSYNLYESDKNRNYEDSYLFNNILGNNISDVLRHVAVKTQMETNGQYDSQKKVDVTAYVNRGASLSTDYVTAVYYLSDLLKWAQYGFKYETRNFTEEESAGFLSPTTTYTHLKSNGYSGGMNAYLNSQIEGNSITFTLSGNSTPKEGGEHTYLIPRYQTVDGKNIENIVSTWEEYNLVSTYVEDAANDLLTNYEEYTRAEDYYDYSNTNLRYYIVRTIDGKTDVYTNISELKGETTGKNIKSIFQDYGKYIYYCPYELSYETNTLIKESVLRNIVKSFSYAYPDQIKMYIAVDTENYPASDSFTSGKDSFSRFMPYKSQLYILGVVAAIIYIILFVLYIAIMNRQLLLTDNTGESTERHGIYTEGYFLIGLLIMAIPILGYLIYRLLNGDLWNLIRMVSFPYICAFAGFVISIGFLFAVYGLIRKGKSKVAYRDSFLKALILATKNLITNTTDNANVIIRTWIPFLFFVAMNILLTRIGIAGIVIAILLDILVGIYLYRQNLDRDKIIAVINAIKDGNVKSKVDIKELHSDNIALAEAVNSIGEGIDEAVNTSMKDEKLKADLITNVSHDIKTPLTSIINYVDLIKREDIDNERIREYVEVLDQKSQKLKQLTEDLVEASKISSGNISIQLSKINFVELVNQTIGEFYEKLEAGSLQVIFKPQDQNMSIMADSRHLWRVIENLLNNVCKYALSGTRVYLDMHYEMIENVQKVIFSIKNISAKELNIDASELAERFIRGDESRTTEGSGLGLSIAKNLTIAQGGTFDIRLDGDLFKVIISFNACE
ncbi:histidine kinase dimerization/phospho-acceptor domain-containing protein [Butyrivibrio sp. XPD2006]|uniref:histidine kinase dimerization/phospho-acceptor domain-containing protein n=1 Tax=Butyrivibrio sp. XPD2006 TaxID=1280668 RepID=UPI0003B50F8D|nr:histidine kinase dimerization/phospho-acceptor domain-containing protein [Butyrivibrio sp. XPD2006]